MPLFGYPRPARVQVNARWVFELGWPIEQLWLSRILTIPVENFGGHVRVSPTGASAGQLGVVQHWQLVEMYVKSKPGACVGQFPKQAKGNGSFANGAARKLFALKECDFARKAMLGVADRVDSAPRDEGAGFPSTGINWDYILYHHASRALGEQGPKASEHTSGSPDECANCEMSLTVTEVVLRGGNFSPVKNNLLHRAARVLVVH